jgi:hypothetical protein
VAKAYEFHAKAQRRKDIAGSTSGHLESVREEKMLSTSKNEDTLSSAASAPGLPQHLNWSSIRIEHPGPGIE